MLKILIVVILILITTVPMYGQNEECTLDTAKDGDIIRFHAKLLAESRMIPITCPQDTKYSIWLVVEDYYSTGKFLLTNQSVQDYLRQQGYNRSPEEYKLPLKRDRVYLEYNRLEKEAIPGTENEGCMPFCQKYGDFILEVEGMINILPFLENDKMPGYVMIDGMSGYPVKYITRNVLILTSILSIEATEYERIDPPLEKYYEDGLKYTQSTVSTGKIIKIDGEKQGAIQSPHAPPR